MRSLLFLAIALMMSIPTFALTGLVADDGLLVQPTQALPGDPLSVPDVDATILRDSWGIAHIYADDAYSLFFANGYMQAQDRLAAMDILRHVGRGELASLTGPSGLELDLVTRRELYTHDERVAHFDALDEDWQDAFQAFADGVNKWIDEVTLDPTKLPVEYPALVEYPEPWSVYDTIAVAQYLLDVFGRGSGGQEVTNAQILAQLTDTLGTTAGQAAFDDMVWGQRNDTYTTMKPTDGVYGAVYATPGLDALTSAQLEAIEAAEQASAVADTHSTLGEAAAAAGIPFKMGSNAQLIDERFTASGKPILYGGPQMGYFTPMVPYEVGLHGAGFDAVGMGVTGAPGVIIGRTAEQSFTITSGASDQVDVVVERLVGDAYHYEVDGEVLEMDCRVETHLVRPGPADQVPAADPSWRPHGYDVLEQEVCRTIHGPVLYRSDDGAYAFASQRSYRGDEANSGVLWLRIGTTRTVDEFQDLFEDFRFTFNFNYANADGDLLYMHVGCQPIRDARLDPRLPTPGWDSSFGWKLDDDGDLCVSGRDLPHVRDPASGYTVNWNNNPAYGWHSGDARELWGPSHRAELMAETLLPVLAAGDVTIDDVRAVHEHASTHHPYADETYALWHDAATALGATSFVAALEAWEASGFDYADRDGDGFHDAPAFRLYELWRSELQARVFDDELGNHTRMPHWNPATGGDPHAADHGDHTNKDPVLLDTLSGWAEHAWCDDVATAAVESCSDQSVAALSAVLTEHPDWADPFPMRKSKFTALGAGPGYLIDMTNRPSFQQFYDWGIAEGAERSRSALPPGNSAHLSSADFLLLQGYLNGFPGATPPPHLEDQLQMYIDFEDKPLLFDRTTIMDGFLEAVIHLD